MELQQVHYSDGPLVIELFKDIPIDDFYKAFLYKDDVWSYEKEWRVIFPPTDRNLYAIPLSSITSVYFGAQMEYERIMQYKEVLNASLPKAYLAQMLVHEYKYELERWPVS